MKKRSAENAVLTKKSAELAGVSVKMAEKVLRMDRRNEKVVTAYMLLKDGFERVVADVRAIMPEICTENGPNCTPNGTEMRGF